MQIKAKFGSKTVLGKALRGVLSDGARGFSRVSYEGHTKLASDRTPQFESVINATQSLLVSLMYARVDGGQHHLKGYFVHKKHPTPQDHQRSLCIGLL